jgi:N-acetylmuramoyl-L-alanine amidase
MKACQLWLVLLWVAVLAPAAGGAGPDHFDSVVIDPGHGGEDHGASGANGVVEKQLVLDVSLRLAERLQRRGLRVRLTRESDAFVPLETRTSAANDARAKLFVSIHANWARRAEPQGVETYFASGSKSTDDSARLLAERENQAFGPSGAPAAQADPLQALFSDMIAAEDNEESNAFARLARSELAALGGSTARDVKQAPFVVLMGVQMPASLIEIGFLSNPDDARALASDEHRDSIASALERAVVAFGKRYDARRGVGER